MRDLVRRLAYAAKSSFRFLRDRPLTQASTSPTPVPDLDHQLQKAQTAWLDQLVDFQDDFGCIQLPPLPMLMEQHLEHCRVLPSRESILRRMPVGGIAAEVGVQTGGFSQAILDICRPSKLHLIDFDLQRFAIHDKFKSEIDAGIVCLHEGYSSSVLQEFTEEYFDFVYIDANHTYAVVKRDIELAKLKIKADGVLLFNDYTYWSPTECMRYGVIQAVNELCLEEDWEVIYFALEPYMYCDVAVRRRHNEPSIGKN